jgi:hypothetical protein
MSLVRVCCRPQLILALAIWRRWAVPRPWGFSSGYVCTRWLSDLPLVIVGLGIWINEVFHVFLIQLLRLWLRSLLIINIVLRRNRNMIASHWISSRRLLSQAWSGNMLCSSCRCCNTRPSSKRHGSSHQIVRVDLLLHHHTTPSLAVGRCPDRRGLYIRTRSHQHPTWTKILACSWCPCLWTTAAPLVTIVLLVQWALPWWICVLLGLTIAITLTVRTTITNTSARMIRMIDSWASIGSIAWLSPRSSSKRGWTMAESLACWDLLSSTPCWGPLVKHHHHFWIHIAF